MLVINPKNKQQITVVNASKSVQQKTENCVLKEAKYLKQKKKTKC